MKHTCRFFLTFLFLLTSLYTGVAAEGGGGGSGSEEDAELMNLRQRAWVDSVMMSLSPDQRLGQLFMVAAYSNKDLAHVNEIVKLVREYNIGGLMFMRGGPVRQAKLTNLYQSDSRVPLLIAMDAEWGLSMRLDSSISFPREMTLGAIDDPKQVYVMGREIALRLKRLGVHVSFSPVVDINSNPANPVIGMRAFGENKEHVADRGISYIQGLQDNGIIAVAKHFPGHGDTDADSHYSLPVFTADINRLNEVELYPFRRSFDAGVMGVMVAHLFMPKFDTTSNRASTLSPAVVTGLLKQKMSYKGLVFTDALNMKGVSQFYKPGEVDELALLAGNDVLLFAEDVPTAITRIKQAIAEQRITQEDIDSRVRKILRAKYWAGLNDYEAIKLENLNEELNLPYGQTVQQRLYGAAITLARNESSLIPFRTLDTVRFASVSIGLSAGNPFEQMLDKYATVEHHSLSDKWASDSAYTALLNSISPDRNVVMVGLHGMGSTPARDFGISSAARNFLTQLSKRPNTKVVLSVFGNPYSLKFFDDHEWLLCAYEDNATTQALVPQVLFGARDAAGKLPVTVSPALPVTTGVTAANLNRLRYANPESVGLDSKILDQIDNIATEAIAYGATPGCQVLVAKDGAIVFERAYGHQTYEKTTPVTSSTLYDIASVTKVAATLQAVMWLKDQGKLLLDSKVSTYLPELAGTNKQNLIVRDVLAHQAGLVPFLPYWKRTLDDSMGLDPQFYASTKNEMYPSEVAPGIYANRCMQDSLWIWTVKSPLLPKNASGRWDYKYSDLSFYIMKRIAERLLEEPIDQFLEKKFYTPLGLSRLTFHPLAKFPASQIAPTEQDNYFRNQLLCGTVHDQGAAMFGGVAGHAGLFSNAHDLAVLMQMNLQNGNYGGRQYFKKKVVTEFAKKQFKGNRRGLGWDKPDPKSESGGPTSKLAPMSTFGHTGFTGTCAWVDPENNLVYIFLSNRIYPTAENNKLVQYNIRTRIQDVIYKSVKKTN